MKKIEGWERWRADNFIEHVSHVVLVILLLTLDMYLFAGLRGFQSENNLFLTFLSGILNFSYLKKIVL